MICLGLLHCNAASLAKIACKWYSIGSVFRNEGHRGHRDGVPSGGIRAVEVAEALALRDGALCMRSCRPARTAQPPACAGRHLRCGVVTPLWLALPAQPCIVTSHEKSREFDHWCHICCFRSILVSCLLLHCLVFRDERQPQGSTEGPQALQDLTGTRLIT